MIFMSVTITINDKTFTKEEIIYVSPKGNDSNDGSIKYPVLTLKKALELCKDDYAINFLPGDHLFKNYNIDFKLSGILIYSDPMKTSITLKNSSINFITTKKYTGNTSYLVNLNIIYENSESNFFTYLSNTKIYNCLIIGSFNHGGSVINKGGNKWSRVDSEIRLPLLSELYPTNIGLVNDIIHGHSLPLYLNTSISEIKKLEKYKIESIGMFIGNSDGCTKTVKFYIYYNMLSNKYEGIVSINIIKPNINLNKVLKENGKLSLNKVNKFISGLPNKYKIIKYYNIQ